MYLKFHISTAADLVFLVFPDRVGVNLDGVMDPSYYSQGRPDMGWASDVESTDEAFEGFVDAYESAGPEDCTVADRSISGGMDLISWAQNLTEVGLEAGLKVFVNLHENTVGLRCAQKGPLDI